MCMGAHACYAACSASAVFEHLSMMFVCHGVMPNVL
jgi:hypothetical protein